MKYKIYTLGYNKLEIYNNMIRISFCIILSHVYYIEIGTKGINIGRDISDVY